MRKMRAAIAACLVSCAAAPASTTGTGGSAALRDLSRAPSFAAAHARLLGAAPTSHGALLQIGGAARADDAVRIALDDATWVSVRPLGVSAVAATQLPGGRVFEGAQPGVDVVHVVEPTRFEELRVIHASVAQVVARYRVLLGPGLADAIVEGDRLVVRDRQKQPRIVTEPLFAADAHGTRRSLSAELVERDGGFDLELRLDARDLTAPVVIDPAFVAAPTLPRARMLAVAVSVGGGKVLIAGGGGDPTGPLFESTALLYDSASGALKETGPLPAAECKSGGSKPYRGSPAAVLLSDGRVALIGGNPGGVGVDRTRQVDLFDAASNTWSAGAPMKAYRAGHTATLLADGRVLVVGGNDGGAVVPGTEIYDPKTDSWADAPPVPFPREGHVAVRLGDGTVLVAGGFEKSKIILDAARFDPKTNTWSPAGQTSDKRLRVAAVARPDGRVMLIGGANDMRSLSTTELYDPSTNTWSPGPALATPRDDHTAIALPSGRVLVAGGFAGGPVGDPLNLGALASAEILDAVGKAFHPTSKMLETRRQPAFALLSGDRVLFAGGMAPTGMALKSMETFAQAVTGEACADGDGCISETCVAGKCAEACTATAECATGTWCSMGKCAPAKPNGETCSEPRACTTGNCIDEHCCAEARSCAPYVCASTGCRTSCDTEADCAQGNVCQSGKCVPSGDGGVCSKDMLVSTGKDGEPRSCTPYRCDGSSGSCLKFCGTSDDCAPGFLCKTDTKECSSAAAPPSGDEGGCAFGGSRTTRVPTFALLAALVLATRRVRRARASAD